MDGPTTQNLIIFGGGGLALGAGLMVWLDRRGNRVVDWIVTYIKPLWAGILIGVVLSSLLWSVYGG